LNLWVEYRNLGFSRFGTGDGTWEIQTTGTDVDGSLELYPCPALNPEEVNPWNQQVTVRDTVMCCLLERSVRNLKWIFHYKREKIENHHLDTHVVVQYL
jgi:hypothetical protein